MNQNFSHCRRQEIPEMRDAPWREFFIESGFGQRQNWQENLPHPQLRVPDSEYGTVFSVFCPQYDSNLYLSFFSVSDKEANTSEFFTDQIG